MEENNFKELMKGETLESLYPKVFELINQREKLMLEVAQARMEKQTLLRGLELLVEKIPEINQYLNKEDVSIVKTVRKYLHINLFKGEIKPTELLESILANPDFINWLSELKRVFAGQENLIQ